MTELDLALDRCTKGLADQSAYYETFLNTRFYIPVATEKDQAAGDTAEREGTIAPIFLNEGEGKSSILLFDTEERLNTWTNGAVSTAHLFGHVIIEMVSEGKYLAVNVGTRHKKEFVPEEIAYLKGVVQRIRAAMERGEA